MLHTCIHWVRNIISKFLKSNINKKSERKPEEKIRGIIIYRTIRIKFLIRNQTSNKRVVQFSSVAQPCPTFATLWIVAHQASLSVTNSQSSPKIMSIESVMPSNHLIFCRPLLLLPSIFPSIMVFSNESALHIRWPKYWSFSFNISSFNEHPGLISFRMDWLDLLAVQGTLKSLLQLHSAFFMVQLLFSTK